MTRRTRAPLTPEQRALRARIAGLTGWANTEDRTGRARTAHDSRRARIAAELDPEGRMTPGELAKRVDTTIRAEMARLSLKASRSRQARRAAQ